MNPQAVKETVFEVTEIVRSVVIGEFSEALIEAVFVCFACVFGVYGLECTLFGFVDFVHLL